jgi:CysZ protein
MDLVIRSALNAIDDLRVPGMFRLFMLCVLITIGISILTISAGFWVMHAMIGYLPNQQETGSIWLYNIMLIGFWIVAGGTVLLGVWLTFWSLVILIANFFDEHIATLIEKHRYPKMAMGKSHPFWGEFKHDVGFLLKIITLNILVIIFPLFWPVLPFVLLALNGYLLGQEFFCMAGGRHVGRKTAYTIAKQHRLKIFLAGLSMIVASTIPILNLVVPFWGIAMMVHLYHAIASPEIPQPLPAPDTPQLPV